MRIIKCTQGEDDWREARRGRITASCVADVLNYLKKGGESAARRDYRLKLVAERLTGLPSPSPFITPEMRWGSDQEKYARAAYELASGTFLDHLGFVLHPTMDFYGVSPDGISVKLRGGIECKCPKSTTHLAWLEAGVVPEEHRPQMYSIMGCCELDWLDFVSFDPRMIDEELQMFVCRLPRDEAKIAEINAEVQRLEGEIQQQIERLRGRGIAHGGSVQGNYSGVPKPTLVESLRASLDEVGV